MTMSSGPAVTLLLVGVGLVVAGEWWSRRRVLLHSAGDLKLLFGRDADRLGIPWNDCQAILEKIGDAFELDPRRLRPDDPLLPLQQLDSWRLGKGEDQFGAWATERFGARSISFTPRTVIELVAAAAHSKDLQTAPTSARF